MSAPLAGKTMFISGASRGIGLAIALRAAQDGANVCLDAKTAEPHPTLEGTIYTAAEQLGTKTILPPWLEPRRAEIEARLTPLPDPREGWPARA